VKNILALTTMSNTAALRDALDAVRAEYGAIATLKKIYFTDYEDPDISLAPLKAALQWADIVLVDIRSDIRIARELPGEIGRLTGKTIVVLVGANQQILALTKMGSFSSARMFKPGTDREFNVHTYIKAKKFSELTKKAGTLLPFGALKHLRNWIIAQQYYQEGDAENLKHLLLFLLKEYGTIKQIKKVPPPKPAPAFGLYVPDTGCYSELDEYKQNIRFDETKPTIGILFYSGMHFNDTRPVVDQINRCLRGKLNLINVFSSVEHNLEAVRQYFCGIDLFLNLQYFRIHGGPYGGELEPTYELLQQLDVPCMIGLRAFETEIEHWQQSAQGLQPMETILGVVLPELDGLIEPVFIAGMKSQADELLGTVKEVQVLPDRIEKLCERMQHWLALRRKPNREKRIAIITYNYPPGEDSIGSAGYLDVLESLKIFLQELKQGGYEVVIPEGSFRDFFLSSGLVNSPQFLQKQGILVPRSEYVQWFKELPDQVQREVIAHWGEPPGSIMSDTDSIILPGVILGNTFLGIQPARGVHEDPDKAYHDKGLPPHHQYLAYYFYLQKVFQPDAILHFGMHGTLEFTKGKEVALSSACYPDILIGAIPHIYYYWIGNTSEATIAKRRSYALCISHASPAMRPSGLYERYVVLEDLIREYRESAAEDLQELIKSMADELHLSGDIPQIGRELDRMKRRLIPRGLHILDKRFSAEEVTDYLMGVLRIEREYPSLLALVARKYNLNTEDALESGRIEQHARETLSALLEDRAPEWLPDGYQVFVKKIADNVSSFPESSNLLRALDGKYILPARGGDPIRDPDVYPSGRGMFAFDPRAFPTMAAEMRGKRAAELLISTYVNTHKRMPETIGIVLWGFETMKTGGDTIAAILSLIGVRIKRSRNAWFKELEVIPLEELNRPRIDVVITICGIFRDTFGTHIELLNRAFEMVAECDEPAERNFVKKHYQGQREALQDFALARIFGPSPTEYATAMRTEVEKGSWQNEEDLVRQYDESMSYAYFKGKVQKHAQAFSSAAQSVDLVTQERDNTEYEVTDLDHYYEFLGGLARTVQQKRGERADVLVVDSTEEAVAVEDLKITIERATRTRLLNPTWIDGMLRHDFHGAKKIRDRVEHLLGFAATTGTVENWVFDRVADKLVFDEDLRKKLQANNPYATVKICESLMECECRGYWSTDSDTLKRLRSILLTMEADIE
jgi:cobaltochelatase CobN